MQKPENINTHRVGDARERCVFYFWMKKTTGQRGEVKPSIDIVKNLTDTLDTTVAFLLGETEDMELLKDPDMLKRLNDINNLPSKDKEGILFALDGLRRYAKTRLAYL